MAVEGWKRAGMEVMVGEHTGRMSGDFGELPECEVIH